jgi:hypothetical protein
MEHQKLESASGTQLAHRVPRRRQHPRSRSHVVLYDHGDASASAPQEVHLVGPVYFPGLASERN